MKNKIVFLLRLIVAIILLQTLYFKFTGAPESKYIFETLGVEPWGRILTGVMELAVSILLLIPSTYLIGAILSLGVILGAILSHLFILGIVVQNDGGLLFILASLVFVFSALILILQKDQLADLINKIKLN